MSLPYPTKVVLPFDIATAQDMNERHANDVALADGSGLDNKAVTADKIDFTTLANNPITHFQPNETYSFSNKYMSCAAGVTSSGSNLFLTIPLPKIADGLIATLNKLESENRGPAGYLSGTGSGFHDLVTLSSSVSTSVVGNSLMVRMDKASGVWHSTNNVVATISMRELSVTFTAP